MLKRDLTLIESYIDECAKKIESVIGKPVVLSWKTTAPGDKEINKLISIVCKVCGVQWDDIKSKKRFGYMIPARHLFCWFASKHLRIMKTTIGGLIGKDHSTIVVSIKKVENMLLTKDPEYIRPFKTIECLLNIKAYAQSKTETKEAAMAIIG